MVSKKLLCTTLLLLSCFSLMAKSKNSLQADSRPGIQTLIKSSLELDLTADQQKKIKEVLTQRNDKTQDMQTKAIDAMETYLQEAVKKNANKNALSKKNKEVQSLYENLRAYQLETWLLVRAQLSEDQLKKLREKQEVTFHKIEQSKIKKNG